MARDYNPNEYETVKERKYRFYSDHPDGRIEVEITNDDVMEYAFYIARAFIDRQDQIDRLPKGTGTALEIRDKELSVSRQGKKYESVNYTSWSENAEESAVGRALDNAGYSGNRKCSREEMAKVQRHSEILNPQPVEPEGPKEGLDGSSLASLKGICDTQMKQLGWGKDEFKAARLKMFPEKKNLADLTNANWQELADYMVAKVDELVTCASCGKKSNNLSEHDGKRICEECFVKVGQ